MSRFEDIPVAPPDAAFSLVEAFSADTSVKKVDLCPGFYRDEDAKPWILPSVRKAKAQVHADPTINHEHLPLTGHPGLVFKAKKLVFGDAQGNIARIASIQTVSGTGANHLAARFLSDSLAPKSVWISDPSWINHSEVWKMANDGIQRRLYPYFNRNTMSLNFQGMIDTLRSDAMPGDVLVLHACAHNPTGMDLSKEQWTTVANICEEKNLIPFFDLAYQGFASGDIEEDAWSVRHFFSRNPMEFAVAQSFSKNFGLYGERVGVLHIVTKSQESCAKVLSALSQLSRAEITTPPSYGARIVVKILENELLFHQWLQDLHQMSGRMRKMRERLYEELRKRKTPGLWEHILSDIGMFSFTGFSPTQVTQLREMYHVYLLPSGRISLTGLTEWNVQYVAEALDQVVRSS